MTEARTGIRLAYHFLGCALKTPEGIATASIHGPLIEALADAAESVEVVAYDPSTATPSGEDAVDYVVRPARGNVTFLSLGPKGTWRQTWTRRRRIRDIVRRSSRGWDALLFRLPNRRISAVHAANRCPRVVTIDGSVVGDAARAMNAGPSRKLIAAVTERRARTVIRHSGVVFVNSELLARRHRSINPNVNVLPWSLRRAAFSHRCDDRLTGAEPNILIAGRITPYKGVLEAFEAFRAVKSSILGSSRLHVAGDGDAMEELRDRAAAAGLQKDVVFHGWLSTGAPLYTLLSQMDVLLHLSRAESFPRIVWEALAHSVLVVCTEVGGLGHALLHERDVLYVPVGDSDAAAAALERLAGDDDLRRRLIAESYPRARETDLERVVERILAGMNTRWTDLGAPTTQT